MCIPSVLTQTRNHYKNCVPNWDFYCKYNLNLNGLDATKFEKCDNLPKHPTAYVQQEPQIRGSLDTLLEDNDSRKKPLPKVPFKGRHSVLLVEPSWMTGPNMIETDNGFGSVKSYLVSQNTQEQLEQQQRFHLNQQLADRAPRHGYPRPSSEYHHYSPVTYRASQPAAIQPKSYRQQPYPLQFNNMNQEWKMSKHVPHKDVTVRRTDSLKIEASPIVSSESRRLEKPDEPGQLQRKVSKEEIAQQVEEHAVNLKKSSLGLLPTSFEDVSISASGTTCELISPSSSNLSIQKIPQHGAATIQSISDADINHKRINSVLNSPSTYSRAEVSSQMSSISKSVASYPHCTKPSNLRVITDTEVLRRIDVPVTQIPNEPSEDSTTSCIDIVNDPKEKIKHQNKFFESLKHSSLSIASYSLVQTKSNIKLYRRLAMKTKNHDIQMTFAKYLLQISKLYDNKTNLYQLNSQSEDDMVISSKDSNETPTQIRDRLLKEAGFWIERLSKSRWPEALYIKGRWHLLGRFQAPECVLPGYDKPNESKAFKCFMIASKGGWAEAHFELANLWKKRGCFTKAVRSYEKGAKENHTPSIYVYRKLTSVQKMAKILLRGQLREKKDVSKGLNYLRLAADAMGTDCAEPAFVLGCIYANEFECIGITSHQDKQALNEAKSTEGDNHAFALKYLKKSAQYRYPDAMYFMGQIFENGKLGQLSDIWQAYQYYSRAAEFKHPGAMLDLSRLYCQGIPGLLAAQNDIAFKWCKHSADLGFDQAEYVLGLFQTAKCNDDRLYYENGTGTEPDFPRALEYFGRAASKGFQPAAEKLNQPLTSKAQQQHQVQPAKRQNTSASKSSAMRSLATNKKSTNNCVVQ
ncbi:hypothetical protein BD560DRAFT_493395 [Blakeslea trispora]|nr:hypothetical protein BD560DRAFT_493395 [Blakeslea trispora]